MLRVDHFEGIWKILRLKGLILIFTFLVEQERNDSILHGDSQCEIIIHSHFFFPYFATSIMLHPCEWGLYDTYRGKKIFLHPPVFFKVNHHTRWWNWKFDDIIGGSGSRSTKESYYLSCHYLSSACPLKKSLSSSSLLIEYAPFPVKIFQRRRKVAFPSRKLTVEENFHLQLKGAYTSSLETHVANEGRAFGFEREAFNEKRGAHVAVGRIRI